MSSLLLSSLVALLAVPLAALAEAGSDISNFDLWTNICVQGASFKRSAVDGPSGKEGLAIQIDKSGAGQLWFNQIKYTLPLEKGKHYQFKFRMKSESLDPTPISVSVLIDATPYTPLAPACKIVPTTDWQEFTYEFTPNAEASNGRISFQLNVPGAKFYFADLSLTVN